MTFRYIHHTEPDGQLEAILGVLRDCIEVPLAAADRLVPWLKQRATRAWTPATSETIDILGHAYDGPVHFSPNRALTADYINATFAGIDAAAVGVSGIRLLGCNSADTAGGQAAIRAMNQTFNTPVWGTLQKIDVQNFTPAGFIDSVAGVLVRHDSLPPIRDYPEAINAWRRDLKAYTGDLQKLLRSIPFSRRAQTLRAPIPREQRFRGSQDFFDDVAARTVWAGCSRGLLCAATSEVVVPSVSMGDSVQRVRLAGGGSAALIRTDTDDTGATASGCLVVLKLSAPFTLAELRRRYSTF